MMIHLLSLVKKYRFNEKRRLQAIPMKSEKKAFDEQSLKIREIMIFEKKLIEFEKSCMDFQGEQIIQIHSMMNFWLWMKNCGFDQFNKMLVELYGPNSTIADKIMDIYQNKADYSIFNTLEYLDTYVRGEVFTYISRKYEGISIETIQKSYLPKPSNTANKK